MNQRVILRLEAARDLERFVDYLRVRSLDAAMRFPKAALLTFEQIAKTPDIGRLREFRNPRLRD